MPRFIIHTVIYISVLIGTFLFIPQPFPLFATPLLTVIWYWLSGHQLTGWFVSRFIDNLNRSNVDPSAIFRQKAKKLLERKKFDEAILACREWLRMDRDSSHPILELTRILAHHKQDIPHAIRELEIAVSRPYPAEHHVALAVELAHLYRQLGRESDVEPMYHRVRTLHSASPYIQQLQ